MYVKKVRTTPYTSKVLPFKKMTVNQYFQEIKPLLLIMRALGRFPYSFDQGGIKPFRMVSIPVLYTAVFLIFQNVWTTYSMTLIYMDKVTKSTSYDEKLYWITTLLVLLLNFTQPITYWIDSRSYIKQIKAFNNFQEDHMNSNIKLKLKNYIKILSFMIPLFFILVLCFETFLLSEFTVPIFLPYVTIFATLMITTIIWNATLFELRSISGRILKRTIDDKCRQISAHRRAWLDLSRLVSQTGASCGFTFLVTASILFTTFVIANYTLLVLFFELKTVNNHFFGLICTGVFYFFGHFLFCDSAHRTTKQIGVDFTSKILSLDLTHLHQEQVNEISLFMQTMAANSPVIEINGFITVNRYLFVSFVSNTVTYLIVLIQFKSASIT